MFDESKESTFSNYLVSLLDEKGKVVRGEDWLPIVTWTDKNGFYSIEVLKKRNYKIRVETSKNFIVTKISSNVKYGSHVDEVEASSIFSLDQLNSSKRINSGYKIDHSNITNIKVTK